MSKPSLQEVRNKLVRIAKGDSPKKPSILVLDDLADFTNILCASLRLENLWDVYGATTIPQAWAFNIRFDFLIVDICLCGDRGDMFVKEYCRRYPGAKTLLITAYPREANENTLIKPFSISTIIAKIKESMAKD